MKNAKILAPDLANVMVEGSNPFSRSRFSEPFQGARAKATAPFAYLHGGGAGGSERGRLRRPTVIPESRLSPEFRAGRRQDAAVVAEAGFAVAGQKQRAVQIDEAGSRGDEGGRGHRQRTREHAADHDAEAVRFRLRDDGECFGEAARLVELHIDEIVAAHDLREAAAVMRTER